MDGLTGQRRDTASDLESVIKIFPFTISKNPKNVFFRVKIVFWRVTRGKYTARMVNILFFDQVMIAGNAENITEKIFLKKILIFLTISNVKKTKKINKKKLEETNCDVPKTHLNCILRVIKCIEIYKEKPLECRQKSDIWVQFQWRY